jgi:two-component system, cell cycle sensor histidine kinase and response regulator CckA
MKKNYPSAFISSALGPADRFPIEHRIFNAMILTMLCISLVAAVQNYFVRLPVATIVISLMSMVFYSFLYIASRIRGYYRMHVWPAALGTLVVLTFMWIYNEGSAGGTHLFLTMAPLIFILFVSDRQRFLFLAIYIGITVELLTAEYLYPSFVRGRLSPQAHFIDLMSATIQIQLVIAVTIVWAVREFRNMLGRVEQLRRKSEERFSEVADQIPVMICESDLAGKITYANRMAYQLTGYTAADLDRVIHSHEVVHPGEIEKMQEGIGLLMAGKDAPTKEYRLIARDGKEKIVLTRAAALYTEGRITGFRAYMIDVTEKKILEEHLRQAQKMESIGRLAGGIAHDFNNILTGILTSARLIEQEAQSAPVSIRDEMKKLVEPIIAGSTRAAELIKNLLVFSRQRAYQNEQFDLNTTVDDAVALLFHAIDKKIEIVKKTWKGGPLAVRGDRSLIESAVINLVVNARDAMPEGGTLTVATGKCTADGFLLRSHPDLTEKEEYAVVVISDTGSGIDEQLKPHLFEPFFTTKEPGKGTGLGLASVYGTVKAHHGSIEVVSRKGEGTSFTLYFPLSHDSLETAKGQHPVLQKVRGAGETILLIDDEEIILRAEELALRKNGYAVKAFQDPVSAVDYYTTHAPEVSCVVLDIVMPKINGQECFARLRAVNPSVKVIVTTGYASDSEFDSFVTVNNLPFIAKPFDAVRLLEAIHTVLHG